MLRPARFFADSKVFHADTCEPLKAAVANNEVAFSALARGAYPGRRLAAKSLERIMSVGYWDGRSDQKWGLDWHRNEGVELTYLARGKLDFSVDGTNFRLSRGNLTVTRPWQLHRVGDPCVSASRLHWIILDLGVRRPHQTWVWPDWLVMCEADVKEFTRLLQHNEQAVWRADSKIERCFERIATVVDQSSSRSHESRLRLHLNQLFLEVLELLRRQNITLDESLSSRRRSVELFLSSLIHQIDQPWTLDSMAQHCGLGRSRFTHYCYELTNMPPLEYLNHCRIDRACQLLEAYPKRSVTDVAFACGFASSQYFATVFRRFTDVSPQTFRRKASAFCKFGERPFQDPRTIFVKGVASPVQR
jgi:AraC family L-rhamnose operon regulatory protein RhaS